MLFASRFDQTDAEWLSTKHWVTIENVSIRKSQDYVYGVWQYNIIDGIMLSV